MTYKEKITQAMTKLAQDPKVVFVGYNVRCGRAGGTLSGVPEEQLIETPVAENLMMGIGIGMALDGWKPVVYFERFDFILNAMDQIVNHLDKIKMLSGGEFDPHVAIRVVVGNSKVPLFTGPTHTQDFTLMLQGRLGFHIWGVVYGDCIVCLYRDAFKHTAMLVEYKDLYEEQV